jgi:hypothetical protein
VPVELDGVDVFEDVFGSTAFSGIFGGLIAGNPADTFGGLVAAPGVVADGAGVGVLAEPGGAVGVAAVPAGAVGVARATAAVLLVAGAVLRFKAAYAAAAAASARIAVAPMIAVAERQLGEPRLPGAPAPHCRHQSWSPAIAAPHFAHARCVAPGAGRGESPDAPLACGSDRPCAELSASGAAGVDVGESASSVATVSRF